MTVEEGENDAIGKISTPISNPPPCPRLDLHHSFYRSHLLFGLETVDLTLVTLSTCWFTASP